MLNNTNVRVLDLPELEFTPGQEPIVLTAFGRRCGVLLGWASYQQLLGDPPARDVPVDAIERAVDLTLARASQEAVARGAKGCDWQKVRAGALEDLRKAAGQ